MNAEVRVAEAFIFFVYEHFAVIFDMQAVYGDRGINFPVCRDSEVKVGSHPEGHLCCVCEGFPYFIRRGVYGDSSCHLVVYLGDEVRIFEGRDPNIGRKIC